MHVPIVSHNTAITALNSVYSTLINPKELGYGTSNLLQSISMNIHVWIY